MAAGLTLIVVLDTVDLCRQRQFGQAAVLCLASVIGYGVIFILFVIARAGRRLFRRNSN
jgi:hypothetical protein